MSILTTAQAAELLHVTPDTVRRMCRDGELTASETKAGWRIRPEAVDEYLDATSNREKRSVRRRRRRAA
jgi:excisionase family DNA binding protein